MVRLCLLGAVCLTGLAGLADADTYQLILQGKVVMADGSPPPKSVGIERSCSDSYGSAPGPITDKKGDYLWRMEVDPFKTRQCVIRATLPGYTSTSIDISGFNSYSNPKLPALVLTPASGDSNSIIISNEGIPSKAMPAWKAATKALDAQNLPEVARQLQIAVQAAPKFAQGWSILGLVYDKQNHLAEARDAFEHAIESDPKMLPPYLNLARLCIKTKDWACVAKTSDELIKADTKHVYPEFYLHQAVARYGLNDLNGAEASVQQAIKMDPVHKRSEYVLGRILEAKGDLNGAREHMTKYIEQDPTAPDAELINGHIQNLGKPENKGVEPELEHL